MALVVENVTKLYGEQKALDNVSLELKQGEVVALLGPNGAGKSTMMKIITCYLPQNEGNVWVLGHNVINESLKVRELVGYLPEHNPLYLDMYVREYLEFVAGLHKLGKNTNARVNEMIDKTGLGPEQRKKIGALSKGYRQRVGIAQALIHDPKVLILDEPTSGLDPNQLVDIRNLVKEMGRHKTVLLSTHIMQEVEAVCNRVIIINKGLVVADAPTDELQLLTRSNRIISLELLQKYDTELLKIIPDVVEIQNTGEKTLKIFTQGEQDRREDIFRLAVAQNWIILGMKYEEQSIEQVFRQLTFEK
jgi:ABC-2 type transport system ATP-binding protein